MRTLTWLAIASLLALGACAGVISKELRSQAAPIRGLAELRENPDAFKDRTVILGGEIIETRNAAQGTTLLVLDKPLGYRDEPVAGDAGDGRFLVEVAHYLDPVLFARGRMVTVAGTVDGVRTEPVGEAPYVYVVLRGQQVYLWSPERYAPYPPYYEPYWYDPFWGPGPWWWRPGFGEHDHHH